MTIYVASSWRNEIQPAVVALLQSLGHTVYDFKNPWGGKGFSWSEIDENWQNWTVSEYREALNHRIAVKGFLQDYSAMLQAQVCVLVLPCGRSAHTEAGYFAGSGRKVYVFSPEPHEPELMYKLFTGIIETPQELNKIFKL